MFFNVFLYFFLLNSSLIYIGYKICSQNFVSVFVVVVELGGRWMEMLSLSFGVCFLTVFFNSFSQFDLHRLHNMLTEFCETTLSHCG